MDFVNERSAASVETMLQAIESGQHLASWAGGCEPYLSKLLGGVDTTANTLSWLLVHLADNPREQELLFEELTEVLGDGGFDNEALPRLPRLKAVIRESHRLTPTISANVRTLSEPIELIDTRRGGLAVTIPANTRMAFSSIGWSGDSAYAEAPEQFQPARWMVPKAERKGSALEALDHNLLAHPFSFGPRMCLGARVAQAELHAMIARLVGSARICRGGGRGGCHLPPSRRVSVRAHVELGSVTGVL
ncbi:cytochrome P450 [Pavlovales sp. CCMP2436]|nr:cytochrome P450 [Pavlovales sp. CCMP2436]